jgi:RNA polymerase sigma-70 factor, ECF subfamily
MSSSARVTTLLRKATAGDSSAADQVVPLIYEELRGLASHFMARERPDHTLQTTALVHEAYRRLVDQHHSDWQNRAHFFGAAAKAMRRILVDHARSRLAHKRGGDAPRLQFEESLSVPCEQSRDLIDLDSALSRLAALNARQARVVELRFFAGLNVDETAEAVGISPKTVKRDWTVARAWLHRELRSRSVE